MAEKSNAMPNNLEAEQALISSMLIDNEILSEVLEQLSDKDFYQASHRLILSAMKMVFAERKPIDIVTLCDRLESDGNLEKVGGISYVTELAQMTPSAANYKYYFDIVRRDSVNRSLIRAAGEIAEFSRNSDSEFKSIQHAEALIYDVSSVNDTSSVKDIREGTGIDAVIEKFENFPRIRTLSGVYPRALRVLTTDERTAKVGPYSHCRPSRYGKTSLSMNIVEHAALSCNAVCAIFSLEMPEVQLIQRLLCSSANVSMADALSGKLRQTTGAKL